VNQIKLFLLFTLLLPAFVARSQSQAGAPVLSFPDSVRIVLENTRSVDATVVGAGFASAWSAVSLDQQQLIQRHVARLKRKKITLRPGLVNYFGAIANAINVEHAEPSKLSGFLNVASQVIENESPARLQQFLKVSRTFFQAHALYFDKPHRLYARDDDYSFEYIAPAPAFDINDTTSMTSEASAETTSPPVEESPSDTAQYQEQPIDYMASTPLWMNPPPPPVLEGAVIRFNRITLNFVTKYDSVFLHNSKGVFSLRDNTFVGENGTFDWSSAGLGPDVVTCNMTTYYFKVNKVEVKADVVKLKYEGKTPGFIPGIFEFRSMPRRDSVPSNYPVFKSYESNLEIQGIGDKNVKYKGGFALVGNKIMSSSVGGEQSVIEVSRDGQPRFVAKSTEFQFGPASIFSNKAKIAITHKGDSITHPLIRMRYSYEGDTVQQLVVRKDKGVMKQTPYSSSYFNIDFAADLLRWNLASDSMNIQVEGARNTVPMVIESVDYYDPEDFRLLKGEGFSFHPVALIANYCIRNNVRKFYSGDLVVASGKEPRDIKAAIQFLGEKGLLYYDPRTDEVTVKEKLVTIYRGFKGEMDYDNLKILSVIDSFPNASLNFRRGYLTVRGVEEFKVSDSLNVRIEPDSSVITLLQNRDIQFNGTINAGNFEISGKGFTLKYDSFYIALTHIDSINFFVMEKNSRGQSIRRKINNSMVGADSTAAAVGGLGDVSKSSGTLFISKANNKSGKSKIPNFPRLDASTGGVIYFDRQEVLDGAYDRSMFFVVPPFKLDSLNDADPSSINFDGTFVSSGMFPKFKEKLHTQSDKSLGFTHVIPKGGYPLYEGDANIVGELSMDNRGLRGNGTIKFLASTVSSSDFIFYPDSVIARGDQAIIEEKQFGSVVFPQAKLTNYDMKWYPRQDKMKLKNLNAPFEFYNATAQMRGTVTISKDGVGGSGKFETRGTELISRDMNFTSTDFRARHARFRVKSEDPNKPLLTGTDVRMRFNLTENYAELSPEVAGVAAIDFPYAQFKTSIPNMRWDVNEQKITMSKDPDQPLEDSYFYTTRKDLDSLNFNAEKAVYDLKTQELKVSGIPYIIVADAKITPENNEVLILENAKIGTLKNTTIVLDTLNAYHLLTEGIVDIVSRKEFSGHATYQYVNFLSDTFAIKMTDFHLEPIAAANESSRSHRRKESHASMQTVATGAVSDKDMLVLGAAMYYKGDMKMYATRPALELIGAIKLDIKNIKNYNSWIRYTQSGDETEVLIDFDKATDEEGKSVNAGLHFNNVDNELYITFLNEKKSEDDDNFFTPSGKLYYDTATQEFKIEDLEKARGNKLSGKVFAYHDQDMQIRFEGPIKLFRGGKDFNITATAIGQGNMQSNEIRMNSFLLVESNIPTTAFDVMARQIQEVIKNEGADEGLGDQTELLYKIADIVGEKVVKDYEQKSLQGYLSLSTIPQLVKPLVISNVNLKWSAQHKAFFNEGKIGISHINKNDINGAFDGFMEVRRNEDGSSVFHLFLKISPEVWYYFGFEDNRLLVHSSNNEFNGIISKKSNAGKAKVGEIAFVPGTEEETLAFINRFRKTYYGIDVPYDLSAEVSGPAEPQDRPPLDGPPVEKAPVQEPAKDTEVVPVEPSTDKPVEEKKAKKKKKRGDKENVDQPAADEEIPTEPKKEEEVKEEDDGF
jgi:hypothetical protein